MLFPSSSETANSDDYIGRESLLIFTLCKDSRRFAFSLNG